MNKYKNMTNNNKKEKKKKKNKLIYQNVYFYRILRNWSKTRSLTIKKKQQFSCLKAIVDWEPF